MKELDKLVENYFAEKKAPELGMDMLLEMVEQSLEEMAVDSFKHKSLQEYTLNYLYNNKKHQEEVRVEIKKETTGPTLHLTNLHGAKDRDAYVKGLDEAYKKDFEGYELVKYVPYKRNPEYSVGLQFKLPNPDNPEKKNNFKVLLFDGRKHVKEDIFFDDLKETLDTILGKIKEEIEDDKNNSVIDIVLVNDNPNNPKTREQTVFKDIDITVVDNPGGTGTKADYVIGKKPNQIFISHKDGGDQPKDFGQYGGITDEDTKKMPDVVNFRGIILKILNEEFGLKTYPSSIDFQQPINDPVLFLKGIFGKDWGLDKPSSDNNADVLLQGKITLDALIQEEPEETPGEETPPNVNRQYKISGNQVLSKHRANEIYKQVGKEDPDDNFESFFPAGFEPVLSTRKGEIERKNFGAEITGLRAAIQAKKGRHANFVITMKSTPENIQFVEHELDKTQLKNVFNFQQDLAKKGFTRENDMLNKMLSSITNYEQYLESLKKKKKN